MYARVSARSGLDIVFDKEACLRKVNGEEVYAAGFYNPENNRIVINPDAKKKENPQRKDLVFLQGCRRGWGIFGEICRLTSDKRT